MVSPAYFDLVITTPQYAVRDLENVVRLPVTITNPPVIPDCAEERWLASFARPRRLIALGGATSLWQLKPSTIAAAAQTLIRAAERWNPTHSRAHWWPCRRHSRAGCLIRSFTSACR